MIPIKGCKRILHQISKAIFDRMHDIQNAGT
jgi:hypothetical protein